jgi:hypothetical protein
MLMFNDVSSPGQKKNLLFLEDGVSSQNAIINMLLFAIADMYPH